MFSKPRTCYTALIAGALAFGVLSLSAQATPQVSTILANGQSYDGIYVTHSGRIIVSHPNSDRLYEITEGEAHLLSDGGGQFSYVVDINEDEGGNLLLTEYDRNLILSMDSDGNLTTIANVPGGNDIVLDSNAAIYVADSKTNKIHQVLFDGTVNEVVALSNPVGLAIDEQDNLYASVSTGQIYQIDVNARMATEIVRVPSQIWHLEILNPQTLLAAGYSSHQIYAIDIQSGNICVVAGGSAAGQADGIGTEASFTNPLDLAFDGQQSVYISSAGRVRKIDFPEESEACASEDDNGNEDSGGDNGGDGNSDDGGDGNGGEGNGGDSGGDGSGSGSGSGDSGGNNNGGNTNNTLTTHPESSGGSFGILLSLLSLFAWHRICRKRIVD